MVLTKFITVSEKNNTDLYPISIVPGAWSLEVKDGVLMNLYKDSSQIHIFQININQSIIHMILTYFTHRPWAGWKHTNEEESELWWICRFLLYILVNALSSRQKNTILIKITNSKGVWLISKQLKGKEKPTKIILKVAECESTGKSPMTHH